MSEELKAVAHIMDRNVPNAHADGCPGCIDWARRMNEYAAKNPEEFKPIDLIARLNFLRSLPNSQRSNDAIDDAMEEAAEQLADLRARLASVANRRSSPPQNDAGVEGLADELVREFMRKNGIAAHWDTAEIYATFARWLIARTPMSELQALGQEFEAGWRSMDSAPRDGSYILAIVAPNRGRHLEHQAGRMFAIRHEGKTVSDYDLGWAVYPGFGGASDHDFTHWMPLPSAPSGKG